MLTQAAFDLDTPNPSLKLVLLCDDAPLGLSSTAAALQTCHVPCNFEKVTSAEDTLAFLDRRHPFFGRRPQTPAIILVEVSLAMANSGAFLRELRKRRNLRDTPVAVFSAVDDASLVKRCWDAGADAFLVAPFKVEEYSQLLDRSLTYWIKPVKTSAG